MAISALDLILKEGNQESITTSSRKLDSIFGNGIPLGCVIELCGMPGIGKTQLCMQLCANVQLPKNFGGVEGSAIYIDNDGSFVGKRMEQMCKANEHLIISSMDDSNYTYSLLNALSNITIYRACHLQEFLASLNNIEESLKTNSNIKLIIIDSITQHFRSFVGDSMERSRILYSLAQRLKQLASIYNLSVIMVNQMSTKVQSDGNSIVIPALGESWGHSATHRIILLNYKKLRQAWLCKSATCPEVLAPYVITTDGIRDVEVNVEIEQGIMEQV
ncbi:P-loop containing nucleoside triphosphate hydrolase protein [Globomyces pollinis-pini]|nr:P-loop containing nucleoside triphosphate hydrolase protein [Globomyces pollinis-pini]